MVDEPRTVVVERRGGGTTAIIAIIALLILAIGGYMLITNEGKKDNAVATAAEQVGDAALVWLQTLETARGEALHADREQIHRAQHVGPDQRLEHVQFEMALKAADSDRGVISHHLRAHHRESFTLCWIDFTGHNGRPGFIFRQAQLTKSASRA